MALVGIEFVTHFNPRSPCGERRQEIGIVYEEGDFNPRSPCGERPEEMIYDEAVRTFQSTLPVWGATVRTIYKHIPIMISIHAPRVGSDVRGHPLPSKE